MSAVGRVTVGVSGSARNLSAVRYAAALARGHAAMLIPVLAWVPPGGEAADRHYPSPYLRREWEQAAWKRLHDAINLALGGMPSDLAAKPTVVLGHAGPALVRAAGRGGDLLVIGTGRRGIAGRLAGRKVSRYCLARASCPVLAVPPASLELEAGHGLHGWAFRHRGLSLSELTADLLPRPACGPEPRSRPNTTPTTGRSADRRPRVLLAHPPRRCRKRN